MAYYYSTRHVFSSLYFECANIILPHRRDDKLWCIEAGLVHHRVPTFGFIVKEKEKPGALKKDVLMALGIPPGNSAFNIV